MGRNAVRGFFWYRYNHYKQKGIPHHEARAMASEDVEERFGIRR